MTDVDELLRSLAARYAEDGRGRRIRERANIQQKEMAERLGMTVSGLWRWEHGQRKPRGPKAEKWAQILSALDLSNAKADEKTKTIA